jgi:integrase/recombinase XerD
MTERSLKIKPQKEIVKDTPNTAKSEVVRSQERDPYYTHGKLERLNLRIRQSVDIRPQNKQLFFAFVKWLTSDATAVKSESRVLKYHRHFWLILRLCNKDMDQMTKQDVAELLDKIKAHNICGGKPYSPATYADFLRLIKIFWKWMKTAGESLPEEVRWIKITDPPNKIKAENIPTEQEIHTMREAMRNPRDKALIMVMKESGWRIGEHLETKIKNVSYTNDGLELNVVSPKTGELLWTLLIEAVPWLQLWLENHPDKNNPEAYLWVTTYNGTPTRITHTTILNLLKNGAARAGLRKRIHPHIFRDYRVKELLLGKPEKGIAPLHPETVRRIMGWKSMKMLERYGPFMNSDLRDIYLRISGKKQVEVKPATAPTKPCPICTFENPNDTPRCIKCARALNLNAALQDEQKRKRELAETIFQILRQYGVQINEKALTLL